MSSHSAAPSAVPLSFSERLQAVTEAFAASRTQEDVFGVILTPALEALNAVAGAVLLVDRTGTHLELVATQGNEEGMQSLWQDSPLDSSSPAGDALERREGLFFGHSGALTQAYPELETRMGRSAAVATAVLPMILDDRPLGTLILDFREPHDFTEAEIRFLRTLAAQGAVALGRTQLQQELEARVAARTTELQEERAALDAFVAYKEAVGSESDVMVLARQAVQVVHASLQHVSAAYYELEDGLWKARVWSEDMSDEVAAEIQAGVPEDAPDFNEAARSRIALFVDGWNAEANELPSTTAYGAVAFLPLIVNGETHSLFAVGTRNARAWTEREKALARAVARGLSITLERTEITRQLQAQNAELDARTRALEAFAELTRNLTLYDEPYTLIQHAQQLVLSLLPDGYALYLEPVGEQWVLRAQTGDMRSEGLQRVADAGLPYHEAENLLIPYTTHAPYYQDQYDRDTDNIGELVAHLGASATFPVVVEGRPRGVFAVVLFGKMRPWGRAEKAVMESVTRSLSLALESLEARRTLNRTQHYLKVVADHAPIILFATDDQGIFTLSEGSLLGKLGLRSGQAVGHEATSLFAHEPELREGRRLNRALAGKSAHDLMHFESKEIILETWFIPVKNPAGEVTEVVGVSLDVTERLDAQRHLERTNEELRRSNAELEQFAYIASHDLQAPIRAVTSFAGMIDRRYGEKLDERGRLYLRQIVEGGEHMKRLVDDLLAFSRVHTQQGELLPVDAQMVFSAVARRLQEGLLPPGASITHGALPVVLADAQQFDQLLQNLISNGLKYRQEGGLPRVHVSAVRDGDFWRFAVSDNGIGIEPQYFERIFEIFQRLHGRESYEGTGIGLAVCKKIVERHGGRLWLESTVGTGSTFFFTLPKA
ncbi:ATP-binding protein [Deinococcus oregonensis]|uniref:histidine kinase n=1 Tax=Deinococcus oregonensis TaxID=1805970 RepID=A0ABV6B3U1_9DEIO